MGIGVLVPTSLLAIASAVQPNHIGQLLAFRLLLTRVAEIVAPASAGVLAGVSVRAVLGVAGLTSGAIAWLLIVQARTLMTPAHASKNPGAKIR